MHCHQPPQPETCPACRIFAANPAAAAWSAALATPRAKPREKRPASPCAHLGEPTGESVRCPSCRGTVELKLFACGVHGTCTPGKKVEGVACCIGCPDRTESSRLVIVPEPPPLTHTPTSNRAVVTVAAGDVGRELLAISGPLLEAYARRAGADFIVLDWPGHPDWPMSCKYAIGPVVAAYDQTLSVDADVVPGEHDLLAICDPKILWAYDELRFHRAKPHHAAEKNYQRTRAALGMPPRELDFYLNAGVVVASRQHAPLFAIPDRPIPPDHCAEQDLFNARLHDTQTAWWPLNVLVSEWWTDPDWLHAAPGSWRHFAGITKHADRIREMRRFTAGSVAAPR